MTNDRTTEHPQDHPIDEALGIPSSGRGADSALDVLIKRRLPLPPQPDAPDEGAAPTP
jgi:hypothetical protein